MQNKHKIDNYPLHQGYFLQIPGGFLYSIRANYHYSKELHVRKINSTQKSNYMYKWMTPRKNKHETNLKHFFESFEMIKTKICTTYMIIMQLT